MGNRRARNIKRIGLTITTTKTRSSKMRINQLQDPRSTQLICRRSSTCRHLAVLEKHRTARPRNRKLPDVTDLRMVSSLGMDLAISVCRMQRKEVRVYEDRNITFSSRAFHRHTGSV